MDNRPTQLALPLPPREYLRPSFQVPCTLPGGVVLPTKPYNHQLSGIRYFVDNCFAANFDKPGLGKSMQLLYAAICMMKMRLIQSTVIVCKSKHFRDVWRGQMKTHAPTVPYHSIIGKTPAERKGNWPVNMPIYFVNYEILSRCLAAKNKENAVNAFRAMLPNNVWVHGDDIRNLIYLLRNRECAIMCDESHYFKNRESNIAQVMHGLSHFAKRRYIATGSPASERPDDLWSQIYFLDHGQLYGRWQDFAAHYIRYRHTRDGNRTYVSGYRFLSEIKAKLKTIAIQRTKEECPDMPERFIIPYTMEPSKAEIHIFNEIRKTLINQIREKYPDLKRVPSLSIRQLAHPMLSAAAAPWLYNKKINLKDCSKFEDAMDKLDELGDDQVIIWAYHKQVVETWTALLNSKGITAEYVHGGSTNTERSRKTNDFKAGKFRILVASSALAEAETFTNSHYSLVIERNFELRIWTQLRDRQHRLGQRYDVTIWVPKLLDTMDEFVSDTLNKKEDNVESAAEYRTDSYVNAARLLQLR